ncbi:hypothetical protein [Inquilinus sp. Marseille-Q2685]|uniref:hypothetical protein n=1 Tax=Inquilinus sp. Marseille-Q2685 TaxID=2866581 RepID=UPI001CE3BFEF|nr:hypothetical protein [Inquilinus sp. Marseille-Q2685]
MHGSVHITPAIWIRDENRSPIALSDADDLADWLGRKCTSLMRSPTAGKNQILELEGLLARVEAAIDAGHLAPELRRDVVATIAGLSGVFVTAALPDGNRPVPAASGSASSPTDRHHVGTLASTVVELRRV